MAPRQSSPRPQSRRAHDPWAMAGWVTTFHNGAFREQTALLYEQKPTRKNDRTGEAFANSRKRGPDPILAEPVRSLPTGAGGEILRSLEVGTPHVLSVQWYSRVARVTIDHCGLVVASDGP